MVEAVASEEPQTAPNPAQAAMAAIATPPRTRPTSARIPLNRSRDIPVSEARYPMRMKSGTTERS